MLIGGQWVNPLRVEFWLEQIVRRGRLDVSIITEVLRCKTQLKELGLEYE